MPLVAAAVCPHPPVIVPEVAGPTVAAELAELRAACDAALSRLAAAGARRLLVVGGDESDGRYSPACRGSFAPWGVALDVSIDAAAGSAVPEHPAGEADGLPLSLLVGAWLVRRAFRPARPVTYGMETVGWTTQTEQCLRRGARLGDDEPWALLVMGDGSACRGEKSPGYVHPGAESYDDGVAAALGGADAEALRGLDPELSARLRVAGRAPWQLLAGAALAGGARWRGDLSYYAAPYGVAYFVAYWERA